MLNSILTTETAKETQIREFVKEALENLKNYNITLDL